MIISRCLLVILNARATACRYFIKRQFQRKLFSINSIFHILLKLLAYEQSLFWVGSSAATTFLIHLVVFAWALPLKTLVAWCCRHFFIVDWRMLVCWVIICSSLLLFWRFELRFWPRWLYHFCLLASKRVMSSCLKFSSLNTLALRWLAA